MTTNLTWLELREAVATKVMGLEPRVIRVQGSSDFVKTWSQNPFFADGTCTRDELIRWADLPAYEANIEAAWQMEARIIELGLEGAYGAELLQELSGKPRDTHDVQVRRCSYFALAHASPEARCRAAIAAMEHKEPS